MTLAQLHAKQDALLTQAARLRRERRSCAITLHKVSLLKCKIIRAELRQERAERKAA